LLFKLIVHGAIIQKRVGKSIGRATFLGTGPSRHCHQEAGGEFVNQWGAGLALTAADFTLAPFPLAVTA
jgi:hypothetical protein